MRRRPCLLGRRAIHTALLVAGCARTVAAQGSSARIEGTVTDSVHRRPLAGATVVATPSSVNRDSVSHSALTDTRGHFLLAGLLTGPYTLYVEHPFTDSSGISVIPIVTQARTDGEARVALSTPSAATLRRALCGPAFQDSTLGVLLGTVRRVGGSVVAGAKVVFVWNDFDVDRATAAVRPKQLTANTTTDSLGAYRACGLPIAHPLILQAQSGSVEHSGILEEQIGEGGILVRDFNLASDSASAAKGGATSTVPDSIATAGHFVITGRIEGGGGQPIASAQVRLFGDTRAVTTNDSGRFRLAGLPGGTQGVEVVALGYYPRRVRVEIDEAMSPLSVRLDRVAAVLDTMRVTAKALDTRSRRAYHEFDQRSARRNGFYVTEEQIARQLPFETSDLLRFALGVRVNGFGLEARVVSSRGTSRGRECTLDVFIDGVKRQPSDINSLSPRAIHGIEMHTVAGGPPGFIIGPCGAIFLWTK